MNIDDMSDDQVSRYASSRASDSDWRALCNLIELRGPEDAEEALMGGEYGVWNTYGGSSHLWSQVIVRDDDDHYTVSATGYGQRGQERFTANFSWTDPADGPQRCILATSSRPVR